MVEAMRFVDRGRRLIYPSQMGTLAVAPGSTFCPGATRALEMAQQVMACDNGRVYSYGPLIHNGAEVARLASLGLEVLDPDSDRLPELNGVKVVLRAHGIDSVTEEMLRSRGAILVDTTCPTVKEAQDAVIELGESGFEVLLLGSPVHPEVKAIVGRAGVEVTVIDSDDALDSWVSERESLPERVGIACQTTIRRDLLESTVEKLGPLVRELEVKDTVCPHVSRRRKDALGLCDRADVMIVVGGRNSSNTANLAGICEEAGVKTYRVESGIEIAPEWIADASVVGVTGGASTPEWSMSEVMDRLRELGLEG